MKSYFRYLFLCVLATATAIAADKPTPPSQPTSGPGGSDYAYANTITQTFGEGDLQYWIFTPDQPRPDHPLPVVVFTHGWGAMEPASYQAWIQHIVRKGNIVIYPRYQATLKTPAKEFTQNALSAVRAAINTLQKPDQAVKPQLDLLATVGHSAGGMLAANLAVEMPRNGLPAPKAVLSAEPGISWGKRIQLPLSDMSAMASSTLLLAIVGDNDRLVKDVDAKRIFKETTSIPSSQKNYIEMISDDHGAPELIANHLAPSSPLPGTTSQINMKSVMENLSETQGSDEQDGPIRKRIRERMEKRLSQNQDSDSSADNEKLAHFNQSSTTNALDYFATWKLFDALTDAAFFGKNRDVALGGGNAQTFMGNWSDGVPVKPLKVSLTP